MAGHLCASGQCATPCVLENVGAALQLRADCVTSSTIVIPDSVDFNGNGKTISLVGEYARFDGNGVTGRNGRVSNLTVDGSGLSGPCASLADGINLLGWSAGEIGQVTAQNIRCGIGIAAFGPIDILMANVSGARSGTSGVPATAIALAGNNGDPVTVAGCQIRDADIGLGLYPSVNAETFNNDIANVTIGIDIAGSGEVGSGPVALVDGSFVQEVETAGIRVSSNAAATISNSTITGPGSGVANSAGLLFEDDGNGAATDNTISDFACGIRIERDAGTVTQSGNTFTNTGEGVCDFQP